MTIFDEIGGARDERAVDGFYERVLADPTLAPYFDDVDLGRLKGHQRSFIAAAIGGPDAYLGRAMSEAHAHLDVTPVAFAPSSATSSPSCPTSASRPRRSRTSSALAPLKDEVVTAAYAVDASRPVAATRPSGPSAARRRHRRPLPAGELGLPRRRQVLDPAVVDDRDGEHALPALAGQPGHRVVGLRRGDRRRAPGCRRSSASAGLPSPLGSPSTTIIRLANLLDT